MLILTRRANETIVIGDNVRITVLEVHGRYVRFGITAPRSIVIDREEVYDRKRAERGAQARDLTPSASRRTVEP